MIKKYMLEIIYHFVSSQFIKCFEDFLQFYKQFKIFVPIHSYEMNACSMY